jgi:hypothetical protein
MVPRIMIHAAWYQYHGQNRFSLRARGHPLPT